MAEARTSAEGFSECRDGEALLQSLERELAAANARRALFGSVYSDQFSSNLTLVEVIPPAMVAGDPRQWPADIDCPSLQEKYQSTRDELTRVREKLRRQRAGWLGQPKALLSALESVWRSRQRLMTQGEVLHTLINTDQTSELGDDTAEALEAVRSASDAVSVQLSNLRRGFFGLLTAVNLEVTPRRIAELLTLWRGSYEKGPIDSEPADDIYKALPETVRDASREYFRLAELDILVQRNALNDVRAWLWQFHESEFNLVGEKIGQGLLIDEGRAFHNRLQWLVSDSHINRHHRVSGDGSRFRSWIKVVEYLLGILALVLLAVFAQKLAAPAARLQSRFAQSSRKRRLAAQISRITASLPLLLPWFTALLGLWLLQKIYAHYHLPLLISVIPVARLYILYGLLCLAGEWLLQRIALQAGTYINEEQLTQVQRYARGAAALAVLPLLIKDFIYLAVGPSKLLDLWQWVSLVAFLLAIGLLLRSRRQDFIDALKSVLPSQFDRGIEKLLGARLFLLVAPIAAPPLLLALLGGFLHKALFDYDWYRKVFARSFKLRAATAEAAEPEVASDSAAMAEYERWFRADHNDELPFIDSGLCTKVRKSLDLWLEDKASENSQLLSGARGAGKTCVLHRLQEEMEQEHPELVVRFVEVPAKTITAAGTLSLLGEALNANLEEGPSALVRSDAERQPTLMILDNAQNLFLRRVGGLSAWETLLGMTNARVENVFWLIVINNQSWAYLSNVYGKDYQFRHITVARPWSQNEVRSLILSRNHLSGFKIRYDDILLATRGPEAGSIRNAEQLYFSLLWDACLGNPMLALKLWMTSIHLTGNTAVVGLPEEESGAWLEQLSNDLHFVYAAIIIHENMTSDELVESTALPERVVRTALKTAFDAGFIQRSEKRRYRIVPLWYPTIMKLLSRKNLLHE
ncbi:AAA family ATPase [Aestuariicella hydrocarbonica]|uniref:AAA family ATPase n=1 Tax=Pseudomaricurvus hydrocarbonicus TaxID=1470433 RepID=A0A9E5MPV1_9GAMM|nr:ATP-binding protein [Aestuariicella hydrocarbonica]NHO68289.1 AAA family ATPase [Aestuariicella hydrocarbonica]